jgi:hypothetical protein
LTRADFASSTAVITACAPPADSASACGSSSGLGYWSSKSSHSVSDGLSARAASQVSKSLLDQVLRSSPIPHLFSPLNLSPLYTLSYLSLVSSWEPLPVSIEAQDPLWENPLALVLPAKTRTPFFALLLCGWPYSSHRFIDFQPLRTDSDPTELRVTPHPHFTHTHELEHVNFCLEPVCPTHYPYGGNIQVCR